MAYKQEHIEKHKNSLIDALKWESRDYITIEAANRSVREIGQVFHWNSYRTVYDLYKSFKELLLSSDKVLVFQEISRSRMSGSKRAFGYSLIKVLNDAHFDGISPRSDLIFIDYAEFLQKAWDNIGAYLKILSI